ncbi:hypothetical protein PAECIP111893_00293 [Paenibacillus plantiphilus]|uniref:Phage protein n=1 Tax=Paenibacillus plantiphilus TaxID=2905650 RepID=A0ABN8FWE4_9BACL|nr:hypothetical protein [Paenibacillus plantiphilus]CAH1190360.1 hypothetical protein PAECIP111893_00293 [Paenibacillus plantiphilus]
MIREAIDKILSLAKHTAPIQTAVINGRTYTSAELAKISQPLIDNIEVHNLSGIVEYLQSDFDKRLPVIIHVISPTEVHVLTGLNDDHNRSRLIKATALLPRISFNDYYDLESFNILLQSCFVPSGLDETSTFNDRDTVLKLVGNVKDEQVMTFGDDGVSQQVTAKTGVAQVEPVVVPNPVRLKPFRTFVEIEQPLSSFVLRMKKGPAAALFEADGGAWKVTAIAEIKSYFTGLLAARIEAGEVVIVG